MTTVVKPSYFESSPSSNISKDVIPLNDVDLKTPMFELQMGSEGDIDDLDLVKIKMDDAHMWSNLSKTEKKKEKRIVIYKDQDLTCQGSYLELMFDRMGSDRMRTETVSLDARKCDPISKTFQACHAKPAFLMV